MNLAYQSCVLLFLSSFSVLYVVIIHLHTIMRGLTTEEFKNLLEKALEPLRISIDEVNKSFVTANSDYDQLRTKM